MPSIAAKLGEWVSALRFEELSPAVVTQTKRVLFDALGAIQAGAKSDNAQSVLAALPALFGPGKVGIPGTEITSTAAGATLAGGFLAEVFEVTDGYKQGGCHPGSVVVPTALALQQVAPCTAEELLISIAVGYEVMLAVAEISHPSQTWRGFAPTGTCGVYGAAACASRMLGLTGEQTVWALGNAGFVSPFSLQVGFFDSTVKPLHAGQAAFIGLQAAYLAKERVTGPADVLEGEKGFWSVTGVEPDADRVFSELGTRMERLYFKPYPTCRHTHAGLDAVLALRSSGDFSSAEIDRVEIRVHQLAESIVNDSTVSAGSLPVQCQFNLPYLAAAALIDGTVSLHQLSAERISDPKILDLARKITVSAHSEYTKLYPDLTVADAEIRLTDGRVLTCRVDYPKGDPNNPLTDEELITKFSGLVGNCSQDSVKAIWDEIRNMTGTLGLAAPKFTKLVNSTKGDVNRCQNTQLVERS